MSLFNCNCKCNCTIAAIIVSIIVGVITACLQITGAITVAPVFLWVVSGIAVVYLGILVIAAALTDRTGRDCLCETLNTLLIGILGTILLALILLAAGIVATSVISAILVGLLLLFVTLVITSTACLIRQLIHCGG